MVGDSPADWKASEAANVPFVFARYGFGAAKFGAAPPDTELVIDHARELESARSSPKADPNDPTLAGLTSSFDAARAPIVMR